MTREEAVIILDGFKNNPLFNEQHFEALDMAISALSENKGDLISRQAVLDELEKWDWQDLYLPIHFKRILDDVPSVENKGEDRPKGHWIEKGYIGNDNYLFECSECHHTDIQSKAVKVNYCWHCGADMRGEE